MTEEHTPDAGSPDTTKADANLFAELGFSQEDAQRYQAESRERIDTQVLNSDK